MRLDTALQAFEFEHSYNGTSNLLRVSFTHVETTQALNILIHDARQEVLGFISGRLFTEPEFRFHAFSSDRYSVINTGGQRQIPRAVGGSIAEIVLRGIVQKWYSSDELSIEGRAMYSKYLSDRSDLRVTSDGDKGYVVRKQTVI